MKGRKIVAVTVLLAMLLTTMPILSFAEVTTNTTRTYEEYAVTHKGINWKLTKAVVKTTVADDDTTSSTIDGSEIISYINDAGNLYSTTENKKLTQTSVPYGMLLYSNDNADNMFCAANFKNNHDFEMKFRFSETFYMMFYTGQYRHYIQFYNDSEIHYTVDGGESLSIEADIPWNTWHTLKLSVRNGNIGTISINGKEIVTYAMPAARVSTPYFRIATYHYIDAATSVEVEYAKMTPVTSASSGEGTTIVKTASITVPESIDYGESIDVSVATAGIENVSRYDYYINGQVAKSSASASESLLGLRAGTAAISAKVICTDGSEYRAETKYVDVNAGATFESINMSREYMLDYTYNGTSGSTLTVHDGYFKLDFTYGNNSIVYTDNFGNTKTYTGAGNGIGAGDYRIVATSGNAEVYYNNHFIFSCLMPYVNDNIQNISYTGGISNINLQSSGVKAERYYNTWSTTDSIEVYDLDFDMFYSLEFNKANTDNETIVIYDGEYQAKLIFDERGITAMSQPEDYKIPEEFNLTDTVKTGYYRLTVARGIAQLFVNNDYINSFKCPVNPHAQAVMRTAVETGGTRFVSIKNTDDIYYHKDDFEGNTEYSSINYYFSENEGEALAEGENDTFTQEIVTENGNSYLKISDEGLKKESYTGYANNDLISQPVGDWNLNATPDNPVFKWRAKADGSGEIHFLARHFQKGFFVSVSYSFTDEKWYINRYSRKSESIDDGLVLNEGKDNISGDTTITRIYRIEREAPLAENSAFELDTLWHNYEMVLNDGYIALYCDDTKIIEYSGLVNGHGKMGFGVAFGASLCIDDVEYAGNSKAALGLRYLSIGDSTNSSYTGIMSDNSQVAVATSGSHGTKDFYKAPDMGVVTASANYYNYNTLDNGKTWYKTTDNGHWHKLYQGTATLNLMSGLFMRIGSANWGKPVYNEETGTTVKDESFSGKRLYSQLAIDGNYQSSPWLNGAWAAENVILDPDDFPSNIYNQSTIASQLVQVQDGDYKGRIFMSKSIGGERYGGEALFYTDVDRKFVVDGESVEDYVDIEKRERKELIDDVWSMPETSLTYDTIGVDIQESKVVDMPNSVIRLYGRGDTGFITYSESYDGGVTWSKAVPSEFIGPRCSYGVVRDPDNLEHYYAFWAYEANTSDKMNDGGRPRTRMALAASFDGGDSWQYIADIEELTDNWKLSHDGTSTLSTPQNHGLRVIDGVIYMSYGGNGVGYSKLYTLDTNMVKPLARFSEVHDKKTFYVNGATELSKKAAILPKESGMGKINGTTVNVTVVDGNYSDAVIAKTMNVVSSGSGTFGGVTVTPDANGNFDIIKAAEAFGKKVVETEKSYIISDTAISRVDAYYLESIGIKRTAAEDRSADFLNRFNLTVEYSETDDMISLIKEYADLFDFEIDASNEEVFEKMLGYTYYSVDDIGKIYGMLCTAANNAESGDATPLALSTARNGFEDWDTISDKNAVTVNALDNTATVAAAVPYSNASEYGTTAFELPDCDIYALNLDVKITEGTEASIKWGNSSHLMQLVLNASNNSGFDIENDKIPITVSANKWYNICVLTSKATVGRDVIVKIAEIANDGTVGEYMEYTFDGVTGTAGRKGFWIETADGGSASLKRIRLYTDETIEVLNFTANGGKANAVVEYLNLDKELAAGQVVMNIFNNNIFAGSGYSDELTEKIPILGTKEIVFSDVTYDIKNGVNPVAKFHMWKDTLNLQTLTKPVENISMESEFIDDFQGAALDTVKWTITTDGDGDGDALFAGISSEDGGVLKLKKTTSGVLDFKAVLPAQADNMVVSYDFKVKTAPTLFQQQWFGSVYSKADGTKVLDRLVYYIQKDSTTGTVNLKCGANGYALNEDSWYSLVVAMTGVGGNREYKFYIKEQGASEYERLWSNSQITGAEYTSISYKDSFRFYEGSSSNTDISFDNLKIVSGTFNN